MVAGGYALGAALLAALALLRQSGVPATDTVWAEDAKIFYAQALNMPFGRALLQTYDGYAQLLPRLLALVARGAPPGRAAEIFALAGAIGFATTACLVFHMSRGHIGSAAVRGVLVASMALLPVATSELLDNMVNLPWWLFFAAFWAFLWRPQTAAGRFAAGAVCFLATASEPLVALFVPLAVARALGLRARREHAAAAGMVLGLAYEGIARLVSGGKPFTPTALGGIGQDYAERVGLSMLGGVRGSGWLITQSPTAAVALGALVAGAVVVAGLSVPNQEVRCFTVVAAVFSAACFVIPVWLRGVSEVLSNGPLAEASRYQVVPLLLLVSILLVAAGDLARPNGPGRRGPAWPVPPTPARCPPQGHGGQAGAPRPSRSPAPCSYCPVGWPTSGTPTRARPAPSGRLSWPGPPPTAGTATPPPPLSGSTRRAGKPSWCAGPSSRGMQVPRPRGACGCPGACGQGALRGRRLGPFVAINGAPVEDR